MDQKTLSTSNGVAANRSATARHFGSRNEQENRGRIDEAADQPGTGDAVDLRPLARHPDGAASRVARRKLHHRHERQAGAVPGEETAVEALGARRLSFRSHAATPWLSFSPFWQTTIAGPWPEISGAQRHGSAEARRIEAGISRGSAAKSSSSRTSTMAGQFGVPTSRASFSADMVLIDDMVRPPVEWTRCFGMSPRGEIAFPIAHLGRSGAAPGQSPRIAPGFAFFPRLAYKPARRQTPLEAAPERGRMSAAFRFSKIRSATMAQTSVLKAEARDRVGKGAARAVRREDKIPAVIYGDKKPPIPISSTSAR